MDQIVSTSQPGIKTVFGFVNRSQLTDSERVALESVAVHEANIMNHEHGVTFEFDRFATGVVIRRNEETNEETFAFVWL